MQRGDLLLHRHLQQLGQPVVVISAEPVPAWLRSLPGLTEVLSPAACCEWRPTTAAAVAVLPDEAGIDAAVLATWQSHGVRLARRHGSGWRVAEGPLPRSVGGFAEWFVRRLPVVAGWFGVLPLQAPFRHDGGHCWWVSLRGLRRRPPGNARVPMVFEDGRPLPHPDSIHDDIRRLGGGRYSVWGDGLYFSTSDGSDPAHNGRRYEARIVVPGGAGELTAPEHDETSFAAHLAGLARNRSGPPPVGRRVLIVISSLGPGGAERQFAYLVRGLCERGFEPGILSLDGFEGPAGHYLSLLRGLRVELLDGSRVNPDFTPERVGDATRCAAAVEALVRAPDVFANELFRIASHVSVFAPDVLHCALDKPNVLGAIAGLCVGVPRIVLSLRNVNPSHIPRLELPWFRRWYGVVAGLRGVVLSANSRAGGADYAAWIGVPVDRVATVHNGLDADAVRVPAEDAVTALRRSRGLADGDPALVGVFRISAEKRPALWLEVVAALRQRLPRLHAFHVGDGPDAASMDARIAELGLGDVVHRLGRQADPAVAICAADLLLLVSEFEGVPNVALEAQWLQRPVVTTAAGGAAEAVHDGVTGRVVELPTAVALAAACADLLANRERARQMGQAGRAFVARAFAVDRMVDESVALYR
ncbi:MAG: glycosyltransferase [Planctomycetes bacterium]|nr:glycosyltransferase [Planctomycetota bacterium]